MATKKKTGKTKAATGKKAAAKKKAVAGGRKPAAKKARAVKQKASDSRPAPAKKKPAAKKVKAAKKRPAVRKTTPVKKKPAAKKVAAKKVAPVKKKAAAKKATPVKKKPAGSRPAPAKKTRAGKKGVAATKKKSGADVPKAEVAAPKAPARKRRRRITKMTVQEALISLESLRDSWGQFEWLHGLILYGPGLRRVSVHREFSFMVIYRGLRSPARLRQAKLELDALLKDAIPIRRNVDFLGDFTILDRIVGDDPAFLAIFGHTIPVYLRSAP